MPSYFMSVDLQSVLDRYGVRDYSAQYLRVQISQREDAKIPNYPWLELIEYKDATIVLLLILYQTFLAFTKKLRK